MFRAVERSRNIMGAIPSRPRMPRHVELAIDRVLDQRYRISEPLGTGGHSQVYVAFDEALRRDVAIKVLDPEAAQDSELRRRFVKEARALAQLAQPNIVAVFDVGEVDGLPFIVMERLEQSLRNVIERRGALDVSDAARIASEIAGGLAAAHARGIIHADLKPSNILFDAQGRAKIADFGIARTPQDAAESPQVFATALYVAPERVEGKPATTATDIYGLGLILYEMLVGKPPFTSANAAVLLRDHVVRPPVPPSHLRPSLPRELDAVVLKALSKGPGLRYKTANEFARAIARIEGLDDALAPIHLRDDTVVMSSPLRGLLPYRTESPLVAFLALHARPIRRAFYTALMVAPLWGLLSVAGVPLPYTALLAGLPAIVGLAGHIGLALAITWAFESLLLIFFVPLLAILFILMGLWIAARDYSVEQTVLALAAPALAPFGLAPAVILTSASLHGFSGILSVAWGALMTVTVAVVQGQPTTGAFVASGLLFHQPNLLSTERANEVRTAFENMLRPGGALGDRAGPLAALFDPKALIDQITGLQSRLLGAEITTLFGTVAAWVLAATMVWVVTRMFRIMIDTVLRTHRKFALYMFASALAVFAGGLLLFGLFTAWRPLAQTPEHFSESVLFFSALTGALVALATTGLIGATRPLEPVSEDIAPLIQSPAVR